ncbi:MAG: hypothetical protein WC835_02755 [Candidatus Paceibacterota bacterium]
MIKQNYLTVLRAGVAVAALTPFLALAQSSSCTSVSSSGLIGLFACASGLIQTLSILLIALALLLFLWGVAKFLYKADDQKARDEGRQFMIWGIIALFVMVAAMQLAGVISRTFGFSSGQPQLNSSGGSTYNTGGVNLPGSFNPTN